MMICGKMRRVYCIESNEMTYAEIKKAAKTSWSMSSMSCMCVLTFIVIPNFVLFLLLLYCS